MIQSLHILRKDVRHQWVDLTLYAALLIAFGVVTPNLWDGANGLPPMLMFFGGLLKILIPVLWLVLIARLVHDESLVGDQQFWITRPYAWGSLLGAKSLFIVIFIALPFVLMQWALLLQAGLNPLHAIGGQSLTMFYFALWVWLPFIAVASVTSTMQRMFMSMLAAVIFWGAVLAMLGNSTGPRMAPPYTPETIAVLVGVLLIGVVLYQYASRNTLRSRAMLVAAVVLIVGFFWCFIEAGIPGTANMLVRHHYVASVNPSLQLVFDPSAPPPPKEEKFQYGKLIGLRLPVQIQGLDDSAVLDGENVSYTLDMPGYHYASPWRPLYNGTDGKMWLFIPRNAFERVHGSNVHMHLSMVATRMVPGESQMVTVADHFGVPGGGGCELQPNPSGTNLLCRFPFQVAQRAAIKGVASSAPCGSSGATHPVFTMIDERSAQISFDPIVWAHVRLAGAVCPGAQLSFVPYHAAENFRLELDIPAVSLDQYEVR